MKISVIIPVYNEATLLRAVVERLFAVLQGWQLEVIAVDDGSTDGTKAVLEQLVEEYPLQLVHHEANQGKGAAVRSGIDAAIGDVVVVQDADLEYDPAELVTVLAALSPEVDAVFGSRMIAGVQGGYLHYILGGKLLNAWVNFLFNASLTDAYTGMKVVRAPVLRELMLSATGFELEAELVCALLARNARIVEVPVSYTPRTFAEGKKIRARDAWGGMRMAWKVYRTQRMHRQ